MAKKKYYAVAEGRSSGVFTDWSTCEKQVKGFAGAKYKSFATEQLAQEWLKNPLYEKKAKSDSKVGKKVAVEDAPPGSIVVYTDGGSINNPGPGGYGIVIDEEGDQSEMSGGFRLTTNNRMEMMAAVVALGVVTKRQKPVHLYSDSSYLVNGIAKGWARKWRTKGWRKSDGQPVLNIDLWQKLLALLEDCSVTFHWVKGHAGNPLNERCDTLAVAAARKPPTEVDVEYEKK